MSFSPALPGLGHSFVDSWQLLVVTASVSFLTINRRLAVPEPLSLRGGYLTYAFNHLSLPSLAPTGIPT